MNTARARTLRKRMTEPERLLWTRLRFLNQTGVRVRRQAPIGPYIVDFACHSAKLVIELDGGGHADAEQERFDHRRDQWLRSRGYDVIRLWNNALYEDLDSVLEHLLRIIQERRCGMHQTR